MNPIELTLDEVLYLEAVLRHVQGTGQPTGFDETQDLAQDILDKLD